MIQPIQTRYNGYFFRSRLEAKWAVFFDSLGLKWEYETEGFNLPSGSYLPDFWLPDWKLWFEVKRGDLPWEEREKASKLLEDLWTASASRSERGFDYGYGAALFCGLPLAERGRVFCYDSTDSSGGQGWWDDVDWAETRFGEVCLNSHNNRPSRTFGCDAMRLQQECDDASFALLIPAEEAAKSARFEHGEKP